MVNDNSAMPVNTFDLFIDQKHCRIRLFCADLTLSAEPYDIVVCSAYRNDYLPFARTLIGALLANRDISVHELSRRPVIDMRSQGCWLSARIPGSFRHIACLELLDWDMIKKMHTMGFEDSGMFTFLKSSFLTLRHLLESADSRDIEVKKIALPVLGAGNQGIDIEYTAVPLLHQCMNMFRTIESLTDIDFYELNPSRAEKLNTVLISLMPRKNLKEPDVFISYSSKQMARAHNLGSALANNGLSIWIAPEAIPSGSNYLAEIPSAISNAHSVVLMLTPDSICSPWVAREIASAIGAGKYVVPAQFNDFSLNQEFAFLLNGIQILPVWSYSEPQQDHMILSRLLEKVRQ